MVIVLIYETGRITGVGCDVRKITCAAFLVVVLME